MKSRIYSSKIFLNSKRKEEIRKKIEAEENIELVNQLISDLDDDYQTLKNVAPELADKLEENNDEELDKDEDAVDEESVEDITEDETDSNLVGVPLDDTNEGTNTKEEIQKPEDEDSKESIQNSSTISIFPLDEIKGTLNNREETVGVYRIEVREKELWIYYNDSTNLNNIMTDVIELLNNAGYTYLSFNRLARSNNAIVFEIIESTNQVGEFIE